MMVTSAALVYRIRPKYITFTMAHQRVPERAVGGAASSKRTVPVAPAGTAKPVVHGRACGQLTNGEMSWASPWMADAVWLRISASIEPDSPGASAIASAAKLTSVSPASAALIVSYIFATSASGRLISSAGGWPVLSSALSSMSWPAGSMICAVTKRRPGSQVGAAGTATLHSRYDSGGDSYA